MVVSNRSGSLVLCGEAGNSLVPPSTQGCSPERSIIITETEQEFSVKAPHCQEDISVVFCSAHRQGQPEQKVIQQQNRAFPNKRRGCSLTIFAFPLEPESGRKATPKGQISVKDRRASFSLMYQAARHTQSSWSINQEIHSSQRNGLVSNIKWYLRVISYILALSPTQHTNSSKTDIYFSLYISGWVAKRIIHHSGNSRLLHLLFVHNIFHYLQVMNSIFFSLLIFLFAKKVMLAALKPKCPTLFLKCAILHFL